MDNYMEYKIMGSVKRIRMKPGCIPSKLHTQNNKIREHSPALDLPDDGDEEKEEERPTACPMETSPSTFVLGNVSSLIKL